MDQNLVNVVNLAGFIASDVRDFTDRNGPVSFRLKTKTGRDFDLYVNIKLWESAATKAKEAKEGDFCAISGEIARDKGSDDKYYEVYTCRDGTNVVFASPKVVETAKVADSEAQFPF